MSYNPHRDEMFCQLEKEEVSLSTTIYSVQNFIDKEGNQYTSEYIDKIRAIRDKLQKDKDLIQKILNNNN